MDPVRERTAAPPERALESADRIKLRPYEPQDLDLIFALDLICFEPVFRFTRRAMRQFAEAPGAIAWIAECDGGELAGFAIAVMEGRVGYVVTLDVAPEWRRRGVARRLMNQLEVQVCGTGGEAMELHVFVGNAAAVQAYQGMGYRRIGVAPGFYRRGLDGLIYRKELSPLKAVPREP